MKKETKNFTIVSESKQWEKMVLLMGVISIGFLMDNAAAMLTLHLQLPIYLDSIGTLLVTILVGTRFGIITGIFSVLLEGILVNPVIPYYTMTAIAIAIFGGWMASKGFFRTIPKAILTGVLMGLLSGICNAPVVILSGGFTDTSTDATTVALLANGQSLFTSAFFANFVTMPFDKIIQCLLVVCMIRGFPKGLQSRFKNNGYLTRNLKKVSAATLPVS